MIYYKKVRLIQNFQVERDISSSGVARPSVYVQAGDIVNPDKVIAEVYRSEEIIQITLAQELEIKGFPVKDDLMKYISVLDGQVVTKGRMLAHKNTITGERIIHAPYDGIIEFALDEGKMFLKSIPNPVKLTSYVHGEVNAVHEKSISIVTNCLRVIPAFMQGLAEGQLQVITDISQIEVHSKGKILFFPDEISEEMVKRSQAFFAAGLIGVSMSAQAYREIGDTAVAVLEGFGRITVQVYDKIKQSDGLFCSFDRLGEEVIIASPLGIEDLRDLYVKSPVQNDSVQVFDANHFGKIGKLLELSDNTAKVLLDQEIVTIRQDNIIGIIT